MFVTSAESGPVVGADHERRRGARPSPSDVNVAPGRTSFSLTSWASAARLVGREVAADAAVDDLRPVARGEVHPVGEVAVAEVHVGARPPPRRPGRDAPRAGRSPRIANTAMSDSGAMPVPTVTTMPGAAPRGKRVERRRARPPRAASGRRTPGWGRRRARPGTRRAASSSVAPSAVLHDEREVLGVEARAADQRAVDLRVRHEVADVARLHAPPVLDRGRPAATVSP